jgi:hypothetical protein
MTTFAKSNGSGPNSLNTTQSNNDSSLNSSSFLYDYTIDVNNGGDGNRRDSTSSSVSNRTPAELDFGKMKSEEVYLLAREFIKCESTFIVKILDFA